MPRADTTYYSDGLLRQPTAPLSRKYLGIQDPLTPILPPPATIDWPQSVSALVDQTVTSTDIAQADNELFMPIAANGFYAVEFLLLYSGNSQQGDFGGHFTFPSLAGPGSAMGYWNGFNTNLLPVINAVQQGTPTQWPANDVILGVTGTITDLNICQVRFMIRSVLAGNIQFRFANGQGADGRIVIRRAGSIFRMQQLS